MATATRLRPKSFLIQGYDNFEDIEKREQEKRAAGGGGKLFRFWMKDGAETMLTFVTDNPPIIEEHQLKLNGKWSNWFTCLKNLGQECPLCDAGDRPYTVGFYVVVDHTEFKRKDGSTGKDEVRILAAKFDSLKQFKKFSKKLKGLVGAQFDVERSGSKSPAIGNIYIAQGKLDKDELKELLGGKDPEEVTPDWEEYLAPKDAEELAKLVGLKASEYQDDDDDVDFE